MRPPGRTPKAALIFRQLPAAETRPQKTHPTVYRTWQGGKVRLLNHIPAPAGELPAAGAEPLGTDRGRSEAARRDDILAAAGGTGPFPAGPHPRALELDAYPFSPHRPRHAARRPRAPAVVSQQLVLYAGGSERAAAVLAELERRGLARLELADGLELIQTFRKRSETVRMIAVDLRLSRLTAYDAVRAIRGQDAGRRIPIVVLGLEPDSQMAKRLRSAGCNLAAPHDGDRASLLEGIDRLLADPALRPRRHKRVRVEMPVFIELGEQLLEFEARDISEGGLGLIGTERLDPETRVTARFTPPAAPEAVALPCRVAWAAASRVGLEFLEIETRARHSIEEFAAGERAEDEL